MSVSTKLIHTSNDHLVKWIPLPQIKTPSIYIDGVFIESDQRLTTVTLTLAFSQPAFT